MSDWQFTIDGKSIRLEDFPILELEEIGKRHGVAWLDMLNRPHASAAAFVDLARAVAAKLEVDCPDLASGKAFLDFVRDNLDLVDDDRPSEFEEGIPLAEGDPSTA